MPNQILRWIYPGYSTDVGLTQLAHKASGIRVKGQGSRVKGQGEPLRPCGSADLKQVAFKNQGFLDF
ncbi:hypothetical protein [aff. Roholtiella sp. LEGE 12411]|uniref:hypothetical protein n=1 Tax=aff. Roholtiella sp. LEGE 12411 TaxID=1828822 RepID=UPI001882168C|nr:hypothetical protein [aff. Roholtiella sp. LEGE 12411]MBE9036820.1 hypothetical protein [aff. Roholtiella sp. LEGE 12411]